MSGGRPAEPAGPAPDDPLPLGELLGDHPEPPEMIFDMSRRLIRMGILCHGRAVS